MKEYLINLKQNVTAYIRKIIMRLTLDQERVAHLKARIKCRKKWYGSTYGGFYIHPDLLNAHSIVYSFGIGKDMSFDKQCIRRHECQVYAFDPTPKSIDWIRSKPVHPNFHFYDHGIACQSGIKTFFLPANPRGTSGSMLGSEAVSAKHSILVRMKSFQEVTRELGHAYIDVVKMDIEGSEYEVLESILDSGIPVKQILVEFHDRLFGEEPVKSAEIAGKLHQKGYRVFAHSLNYEEISFIRQDMMAPSS